MQNFYHQPLQFDGYCFGSLRGSWFGSTLGLLGRSHKKAGLKHWIWCGSPKSNRSMYVCMHAWMDGWMDAWMYIHIHIYVFAHMYKHIYIYTLLYTHTTYMEIKSQTNTYMYVYICIYIYMHMYTSMCMAFHAPSSLLHIPFKWQAWYVLPPCRRLWLLEQAIVRTLKNKLLASTHEVKLYRTVSQVGTLACSGQNAKHRWRCVRDM